MTNLHLHDEQTENGKHRYIYIYMLQFQTEKGTLGSPSKWKIVVCLFVDEETNRSYPFTNGLAHLCL